MPLHESKVTCCREELGAKDKHEQSQGVVLNPGNEKCVREEGFEKQLLQEERNLRVQLRTLWGERSPCCSLEWG